MHHYRRYVQPVWHVGNRRGRPVDGGTPAYFSSPNSSDRYAGYKVTGNGNFEEVDGYITVPTNLSLPNSNYGFSEWNGIQSSTFGAPLAQAGVGIGPDTNYQWRLFWEVNTGPGDACDPPRYDTSVTVSPGDRIYTDVACGGANGGSQWSDFFWEDANTGEANSYDAPCTYGGNGVAEFYVEENPGYYLTWDNGSLVFTFCDLTTGNGAYHYIDSYTYTGITMDDASGYPKASPDSVSSILHGFYVYS
jgi:hypothetical protein